MRADIREDPPGASWNTRAKAGTGLGFAIAREIVEMHGADGRTAKRPAVFRPKGARECGCYLAVIHGANREPVMVGPIKINCRNRTGMDPCVEYDEFLRTESTMEDSDEQ